MQQTLQQPIAFHTTDDLLTITLTLADPSDAHEPTTVTAEISFSAKMTAPAAHEPITVAIDEDRPTRLAHGVGNGHTLAGTLALQPHAHGEIAVVADLFYGERGRHHLAGVLGRFPVPSCHAPAWVLCGCSGSAHGEVTGHVAGDLAA